MAFKIFKRDNPETPKQPTGLSRFTRKIQLTPTVLDASLKGEQKRTELLEIQLKDISATAATAYDELDDLKTRNNMLNEQVVQQKLLIGSLMKQIEDADKEKLELKSFHEEHLKLNLKDKIDIERMLEKLKNENLQMSKEMKRVKSELNGYKNLYRQESLRNKVVNGSNEDDNDNSNDTGNLKNDTEKYNDNEYDNDNENDNENDFDPLFPSQNRPSSTQPSSITTFNYIDNIKIADLKNEEQREVVISSLVKRVKELELELESKSNDYEASLSSLRNTIILIRDSKTFLEDGKNFRIREAEIGSTVTLNSRRLMNTHAQNEINENTNYKSHSPYANAENDDDGGDTFVLSNLSFLR